MLPGDCVEGNGIVRGDGARGRQGDKAKNPLTLPLSLSLVRASRGFLGDLCISRVPMRFCN